MIAALLALVVVNLAVDALLVYVVATGGLARQIAAELYADNFASAVAEEMVAVAYVDPL